MSKPVFDTRDSEKNRLPGAIGYVLFFVPLLANSKSRFCRYCANQGLLAFIAYMAIWLVFGLLVALLGWIPLLGGVLSVLLRIAGTLAKLVIIALAAYYGWKAYNGNPEPLPFINVSGIELIR